MQRSWATPARICSIPRGRGAWRLGADDHRQRDGLRGLFGLAARRRLYDRRDQANFTRPILADTGRVRAEGRVVSRGRQVVTAEAKVMDAQGRVLAHGTSTLLVLGGARA